MIFPLMFLFSFLATANTTSYEGVATVKGRVVYTEKHQLKLDEKGTILESETTYQDPSGKTVGILKNNYQQSLNVPDHLMDDLRKKNKHGTRLKNGKIELFNQDGDEKEETELIQNKNDKGLIVASQGLHYYLIGNYEKMKVQKFLLKFLIPGRLDSYKFVLSYKGKTKDGLDEFEVEIDNWILRMFAPSLILRYHPETKRLIYYKGLSNLSDEKGEMMSVEINYKY